MTQPKDVQPIRDQQHILFVVGCETGLRVGDLLKLTTQQILNLKGKQNKILRVKEGKTQKIRDIYLYRELLPGGL
jgi:hypothetical protein